MIKNLAYWHLGNYLALTPEFLNKYSRLSHLCNHHLRVQDIIKKDDTYVREVAQQSKPHSDPMQDPDSVPITYLVDLTSICKLSTRGCVARKVSEVSALMFIYAPHPQHTYYLEKQ